MGCFLCKGTTVADDANWIRDSGTVVTDSSALLVDENGDLLVDESSQNLLDVPTSDGTEPTTAWVNA